MKLSLNKTAEKLVWILTVCVLITYILFATYTWGRYVFFTSSLLIALLSSVRRKGKITIRIQAFHWFMLLFSGYCALTSIWALAPADVTRKAKTILQILMCATMIYVYYQNEQDVYKLLSVVKWAGYFVSVYAILFYGMDQIMAGSRLNNEFSNINSVGMAAAVACTIQVHEWIRGGKRWSALFMIPCVLVIAATQSRKAMLILLLGIFGVYMLKKRAGKGILHQLVKIIGVTLVALIAVALVYSLPIFDGVRERMNSMLAGVLGTGKTDSSTLKRLAMIDLGIEWFLKKPIGGVGIGCPHVLAAQYLNINAYLHNNFAELLCGGGVLGFVIYYAMYVYLFVHLLRYKDADREQFEVCLVWLTLMLIMDYGMVSYYSKSQWFYLMVHFLNISCLKKKSELMKSAT